MIKSIQLSNFQSHKDSQLEFSDGVNVIVGRSDSGKTAKLRALNWIVSNRPSGDAFRSSWGGDTIVSIDLEDGQIIARKKSSKDNFYRLNGHTFKAFGQDVPEEIRKILNLESINTQFQLDAPFLLSESSAEVARYLNRITKLDVIDRTTSNILSKSRGTARSIDLEKTNVSRIEEELKTWDYLPTAEEKLTELETLEDKVKSDVDSITTITNLIEDWRETGLVIESAEKALKYEKKLQDLLDWNVKYGEDMQSFIRLETILQKHTQQIELIDRADRVMRQEPILRSLTERERRLADNKSKMEKLRRLINEIETVAYNLDRISKMLREDQDKFDRLMPDVCPLCGK